MQKFDDFIKHDRNNAFKVEDYYFLKKDLPSLPEESEMPMRKVSQKLIQAQTIKKMKESMR